MSRIDEILEIEKLQEDLRTMSASFLAAVEENRKLTTRNAALVEALTSARDDLNDRAVKGVVAVGQSVWLQINRALEANHD